VIKCMMPLTTSYAELDEGMDILERAMADEFYAAEPAMAEAA
jgi:4-aminobutyrate aminotransferase-like enzyme